MLSFQDERFREEHDWHTYQCKYKEESLQPLLSIKKHAGSQWRFIFSRVSTACVVPVDRVLVGHQEHAN